MNRRDRLKARKVVEALLGKTFSAGDIVEIHKNEMRRLLVRFPSAVNGVVVEKFEGSTTGLHPMDLSSFDGLYRVYLMNKHGRRLGSNPEVLYKDHLTLKNVPRKE